MADASNVAVALEEEGCVELLPATADEAAQPRMPESKALQRLSWRSSAILVLAFAAIAVLVGAVVVAATRGNHHSPPEAAATSDSIAFFTEPYEDPQGQTVCPAAMTSKGSCKCECAWAKAIGACEQRRDDGTCCYSCCCPGGQAYSSSDRGESGYFNSEHGDALRYPAEGRASRASSGPPMHTTVHVTHHHYDHYHASSHGSVQVYHVGEHVYVRASDGRSWAAEIVDANMDSTYRVRYLADRYRGQTVLVSSSNIFREQRSLFGPQLWWVVLAGILVVLCGLACYLFFRPSPR